MKYLITGITGFAGPHLANLLIKEGHEVYGLSRASNGRETDILDVVNREDFLKIKFIYADLTDRNSIAKAIKENKVDGIFHLAAQSHPPTSFKDPIGTFNTNVMGTIYLVEAVLEYQPECKIMFCSTSEVYGNEGRDKHLILESDRILPSNPYGNSKASMDLYIQERFTNMKLNGFITRAFSHTGPRRGKTFSISSDAFQLAAPNIEILEIGNLETIRVVMDVRDTVMAYYKLMVNKNSNGQVFNVCGDTPRKMEFFTDMLIDLSGAKVTKVINPNYYRKIDIAYQHGDCKKLKDLTGWSTTIPIEQTLNDLLNYWKTKWANYTYTI